MKLRRGRDSVGKEFDEVEEGERCLCQAPINEAIKGV